MPNIAITGLTNGGCGHRVVQTDKGNFCVHLSRIQDAVPATFEEAEEAAIIILKHQFLTRRAAGRTVAQALADLQGFVVRI